MDSLSYETKCRRCGKIHEWAFIHTSSVLDKNTLHQWIVAHLNTPSINSCDSCEMQTIQDYVSYIITKIKEL